jgi:hypothetical protein
LHGEEAFYKHPDYMKNTEREMSMSKTLPAIYTWNTESKIKRIAKQIFSIIIFPIGIYKLFHAAAGKFPVLPASSTLFMRLRKFKIDDLHKLRGSYDLNGPSKFKRLTVEVDGYKIDAMIIGSKERLNNGRWILKSGGNSEYYETIGLNQSFIELMNKTQSNLLLFNYPGVVSSTGLPNRKAMAKAYKAMLRFLEDENKGLGAKEIIGHGMSIGGGAQGEGLKDYQLKRDVKYVFVKDRTFSDVSTVASTMFRIPLGFLAKILGWNIRSVESSKNLKAHEIIIQTASVTGMEVIHDSSKIIDDKVISAKASLAKKLLDDPTCPKKNKTFIGMDGDHVSPISNPKFLADIINAKLAAA